MRISIGAIMRVRLQQHSADLRKHLRRFLDQATFANEVASIFT